MPNVDEHSLLDDNKYIADVLADFRTGKVPALSGSACTQTPLSGELT